MSATQTILRLVEPIIFGKRLWVLLMLIGFTIWMGWQASQVQVDAGFSKSLPISHPYMETFEKYAKTFGGADLISVALINKDGDIYNERFLQRLKDVTDEVFFLPGVDRSRVSSLFTPGVRYMEVTEDGLAGGDVIPRDYKPSEQMFNRIRDNVGKAGVIGRLVSSDQHGAMVVAELLEWDPATFEKLDYREVAQKLEKIRTEFADEHVEIHIIGFAKIVGDVTDAANEVLMFFGITLVLLFFLLWAYCASFRLTMMVLTVSLIAVVWEFGLLKTAGLGLDPFAILVPFLVLSIAMSHGVQYVNAWIGEVVEFDRNGYDASLETFRRLAIPGTTALITDVIGFGTIYLIEIPIIREMAINASMGMAAIIITNKMLMPIWLSYLGVQDVEKFHKRQEKRKELSEGLWVVLGKIPTTPVASVVLLISAGLLAGSLVLFKDVQYGDFKEGVPELRPDSRYNKDALAIADNFVLGVDLLQVIAETEPEACVKYNVMAVIDRYAWHMRNVAGVQSVVSLPQIARRVSVGWNEGSIKWQVIPRNRYALASAISPVPLSSGLKSPDCSAMPVLIFTTDHKATTISRIINATQDFQNELEGFYAEHPDLTRVSLALATGNLGVMAATNEEIRASELPILFWVYAAIIVFVFLSFRTISSLVAIIIPLMLTAIMTYAFMALYGIGLKPATLPMVALGAGIGVDDSIYMFSVIMRELEAGKSFRQAWYTNLQHTGKAVIFTSIALAVSVSTWLFSDLQFQADMGLLLVFMFVTNLFGAIFILPALGHFLIRTPNAKESTA